MTENPSTPTREDQLRATSERVGELRRFKQVASYAIVVWLAFTVVSVVLARVYHAPIWVFVVTRLTGAAFMAIGILVATHLTAPTSRQVSLVSGGLTSVMAAMIGFEAAYLGGATSSYATGAAFSIVSLAVLQRRAQDTWPSFVACGLSYGVGVLIAPVGVLAHMTAGEAYVFVTQIALLVCLSLFCMLLSHHAWTVRRDLFQSRSIGRYKLQRRLGRGGMGEVWAAFHTTLGRDVAVKILRPERIDEGSVQRFEREVRATTALTHPNTVRVFDYGVTEDGLWYYAMELLTGVSLAALVKAEGPQPQGRAVHLVAQAARALGEAHRAGIVHRDVKPENLLITVAGGEPDFVKVIDFGIARTRGEATITSIGEVAGTPSYMAPETIAGQSADARTDIYALGAVLYYLLTGAPPFVADDSAAVMYAQRHDPVVPPHLRTTAPIDDDLEQIVLRCLAKAPDERFADGTGLADALARTAASTTWVPPPTVALPAPSVNADEPTVTDRPRG